MFNFTTIISYLGTFAAAILIFGLVVFIHELGHFMAAKFSGIKVNEFAIGFGPTLFKFVKNETKYAVRLLPLGGFVSMEGEDEESENEGSFTKASIPRRLLVMVAGATMNLILGYVILVILVSMQTSIATKTIAEFYPNALTEQTGLQVGDEIIAINGRRCFIANDLTYEFARTQQDNVDITVLRDGKNVELENVQFETQEVDGQEFMVVDFKIYGTEKNIGSVIKYAFDWTLSLGRMIVLGLVDLVTGRVAVNNLSGPISIVTQVSEAVKMGIDTLLLLTALLTINLGIFNLVPLPGLDGGKILLLMVEFIRRKPLNQKFEIAVNLAGFAMLIGLMLFATFNDITRLFN